MGGGRRFVHEKGEVGRFRSAMSTMEDNRIGSNIFGLDYVPDGPVIGREEVGRFLPSNRHLGGWFLVKRVRA